MTHQHDTARSEAIRHARQAAHWAQEAQLAQTAAYRSECLLKVDRHERAALRATGDRSVSLGAVSRMLAGTLFAGALLLGVSAARASGCESYAELHYAMAESVGVDADEAWEGAMAACEGPLSYEASQAEAHGCELEVSGVEQVAGGWMAFCQDGSRS